MAITTDTAQQQKLKLKRRQKFIALKVGGEIRRKGLCTCLKLYRPNWGHNSEGLRERERRRHLHLVNQLSAQRSPRSLFTRLHPSIRQIYTDISPDICLWGNNYNLLLNWFVANPRDNASQQSIHPTRIAAGLAWLAILAMLAMVSFFGHFAADKCQG